jgi:hypothetical protein
MQWKQRLLEASRTIHGHRKEDAATPNSDMAPEESLDKGHCKGNV